MSETCPVCHLPLNEGVEHRCVLVSAPLQEHGELDRTDQHPDVVSGWREPFSGKSYQYRDKEKRRAWNRQYMRDYRLGKCRSKNG